MVDFAGVRIKLQSKLLLAKYLIKSGELMEARAELEYCEKLEGSPSETSVVSEMHFCGKLYTCCAMLSVVEGDLEQAMKYFAQAKGALNDSIGNHHPVGAHHNSIHPFILTFVALKDSAIALQNSAVFTEDEEAAVEAYAKVIENLNGSVDPRIKQTMQHNHDSIAAWMEYVDDGDKSYHQRKLNGAEFLGEEISLNPSLTIQQLYIPGGILGTTVRMIQRPYTASFVGQLP